MTTSIPYLVKGQLALNKEAIAGRFYLYTMRYLQRP